MVTPKKIALLLLVLFLVSLLPLAILAQYNVPSADDFSYGWPTKQQFMNTGSFLDALSEATATAKSYWYSWQGTFSSIFLMALHPAVFSDHVYWIVPYIMISALILGIGYFSHTIFCRVFHLEKYYALIVSLFILFFAIQLTPSPVSAFFWYNGSVHYTLPFAATMILTSLLIQLFISPWKNTHVIKVLICCIMSFYLGGTNYVASLNMAVIYGLLFFAFAIKRNKRIVALLFPLMVYAISFLISVLSPGNALRRGLFETPSFFGAIGLSFKQVWFYTEKWCTPFFACALLLLAPFLYKMAATAAFRFRYPLLVSGASICFWASCFFPAFFSLGMEGPPRTENVYYYHFLILVCFNVFYWFGYIIQSIFKTDYKNDNLLKYMKRHALTGLAVLLPLLVFCTLSLATWKTFSSSIALHSLNTGEAKSYLDEHAARMEVYQDSQIEDAEVMPLQHHPHLLFFDDITNDPNDWRNVALAKFYGKNTVKLVDANTE